MTRPAGISNSLISLNIPRRGNRMTLQTVVAQGNENITLYEQLKDRLYIVGVKEGERGLLPAVVSVATETM
jgi:hypothetical protein